MKKFLFKPNLFKEILNGLTTIPAFVTGWSIAELFINDHPIMSATTNIIIITFGLLWISWTLAYVSMKRKWNN